LVPLSRG